MTTQNIVRDLISTEDMTHEDLYLTAKAVLAELYWRAKGDEMYGEHQHDITEIEGAQQSIDAAHHNWRQAVAEIEAAELDLNDSRGIGRGQA